MSEYGSVLKLLRTGTLALLFQVGPANDTRGFRSTDGLRLQMCLFGGSVDRPRLQENLWIQVRGYPRPQSTHLRTKLVCNPNNILNRHGRPILSQRLKPKSLIDITLR